MGGCLDGFAQARIVRRHPHLAPCCIATGKSLLGFSKHYTAESVIAFGMAHRLALNNAGSFDAIDHHMRDMFLITRGVHAMYPRSTSLGVVLVWLVPLASIQLSSSPPPANAACYEYVRHEPDNNQPPSVPKQIDSFPRWGRVSWRWWRMVWMVVLWMVCL